MQHTFNLKNAADVLVRFGEIINHDKLAIHISKFLAHSKNKPFTDNYLREKFDISIKLDQCFKKLKSDGLISEEFIVSISAEGAIRFAVQALNLIDYCAPAHRDSLISRIETSLEDPRFSKAIVLELAVATSFSSRGFKVIWPELLHDFDQTSTYDLLIPDLGENGLEVECKAVMDDTGALIKNEHIRIFQDEMTIQYSEKLLALKGGHAVVVRSQGAFVFLRSHTTREALLNRIFSVIDSGTPFDEADTLSISVTTFDHRPIHEKRLDLKSEEGTNFIAELAKSRNTLSCVCASPNGAILVIFQGTDPSKFEKSVHATARDAVKNQLSGQRPGIIVMGMPFSADNMRKVATTTIGGGGSNPLARIAQQLLRREGREHLLAVCFLSESEDIRTGLNSAQGQSSVYLFENESCRFSSLSAQQVFKERRPRIT